MSIKSAQAKQQLRNSDGTFANENKNAGLPSNDMIQHAKSLLDSKSEAEENVLTSPFLAMSERVIYVNGILPEKSKIQTGLSNT